VTCDWLPCSVSGSAGSGGATSYLGFFAGNVIGAVIGVVLIATKRMDRKQPVPYGVFLALGVAVAVFAGPEILVHFQQYR
jgi:prepilin signal peptidase PulO-like enzyme (type II secretory pathway)